MGEFNKAFRKGDELLAHHSNERDDHGAFCTFTTSHPASQAAFRYSLLSFQTQEYKPGERGNPISWHCFRVFESQWLLSTALPTCGTCVIFVSLTGF